MAALTGPGGIVHAAACADDSHGLLVMTHVVSTVHQAHAGEPKICQLDMSIACYQQIVWLQVAVNDPLHQAGLLSAQAWSSFTAFVYNHMAFCRFDGHGQGFVICVIAQMMHHPSLKPWCMMWCRPDQ